MKIVAIIGLLLGLMTGLAAQDSTLGYTFPKFIDNDKNGVNDYYQTDSLANGTEYTRDAMFNVEYKFEFGLGYGYGFIDRDRNGTSDVVDNDPNVTRLNPTAVETRLKGLEMIKRGVLRHNKATTGKVLPGQTEASHVLHDGHCKDEERFNQFRGTDGN